MDTNITQRISREVLFHGSKFDFERVAVRTPSGGELRREVVRHPGAVVIMPVVQPPGRAPAVAFVRNARVALEKYLLELPAGTLEAAEDPEACARRELIEETGYRADRLTLLARFYTSPGFSDELMWAYAAHGLTHVGQKLEPDEDLSVELIPVTRLPALIDSGELADGKSLVSLLLARARGLIPGWEASPPLRA